jgi:hypothetical protein
MSVEGGRLTSMMTKIWPVLLNLAVYVRHPILLGTYIARIGRLPNAVFPSSIEEKFLWRKIFDHNPRFVETSDKLKAKAYAARVCLQLKIPKIYWQGSNLDEVPAGLLEGTGVLKANHGSGFNQFLPCEEDISTLKIKTRKWLSYSYGQRKGEWAYGNIEQKLFIEELICGKHCQPPIEYKAHVCNGKAVWIFCLRDRFGKNPVASFFKPDGTIYQDVGNSGFEVRNRHPGVSFLQAVRIAQQLGSDFDYIRCDLYEIDGEIFFGELTSYPLSGYPRIRNQQLLADWNCDWDLRNSWFLQNRQTGWRTCYAAILRSHLDATIKRNRGLTQRTGIG